MGWLLLAVGLTLDLASLLRFLRARTNALPFRPASAFVVRWPYVWTRNPMYLGLALVLAGLAVWVGNATCVLPVAAFVAYIARFQIAPEERALRARFGESYDAYCRRVGRWL